MKSIVSGNFDFLDCIHLENNLIASIHSDNFIRIIDTLDFAILAEYKPHSD